MKTKKILRQSMMYILLGGAIIPGVSMNSESSSGSSYPPYLSGLAVLSINEDELTGNVYASTSSGLLISEDDMQTWELATTENGLHGNLVLDIASNGNDVYVIDQANDSALTYADVSHDAGKTWTSLYDTYDGMYKSVEFDNNKLYIVASIDHSSPVVQTAWLLESSDQGNSFTSLNFPIGTVKVNSLSVSGENMCFRDWWTNTVYSSLDHAKSWTYNLISKNSDMVHLNDIYCDADSGDMIVATDAGTEVNTMDFKHGFIFSQPDTGEERVRIKKSVIDRYGNNWATMDNGLYYARHSDQSEMKYKNYTDNQISLPNEYINDIYVNNQVGLVATADGIAPINTTVKFKMGNGVSSVNFSLSDDYVAKMQSEKGYTPDIIKTEYKDGNYIIQSYFHSDFSKNMTTASLNNASGVWSNASYGSKSYIYGYIEGNLSINNSDVTGDTYLAVGDGHPNWWFGNDFGVMNSGQLHINTSDGNIYCVSPYSDSENTFTVYKCDSGDQSGDSGTAIHDNTVKIYPGSGIENLKYSFKGFEVTDGQPYQTALSKNDWKDGYLELDFQAGRSDSKSVSNDYRAQVGDYSSYTHDSKDHPDSLNFYILGNLEINNSPIISDVYLGQDSGDDWWLGSKGAWQSGDYLKVTTLDGNYYCVHKGNDSDSSFMISDQCPDSGTQPHMDEFDFDMGEGVYSVSFDMNFGDDEITSGQPHADALSTNKMIDSNTLQLKINTGEKESDSVAGSFVNNNGIIGTLADIKDVASSPSSMYAYIKGDLIINGYAIKDMVAIGLNSESYSYSQTIPIGGKCHVQTWWLANVNGINTNGRKELKVTTIDHKCYKIISYDTGSSNCQEATDNGINHRFKIEGCYIDQD